MLLSNILFLCTVVVNGLFLKDRETFKNKKNTYGIASKPDASDILDSDSEHSKLFCGKQVYEYGQGICVRGTFSFHKTDDTGNIVTKYNICNGSVYDPIVSKCYRGRRVHPIGTSWCGNVCYDIKTHKCTHRKRVVKITPSTVDKVSTDVGTGTSPQILCLAPKMPCDQVCYEPSTHECVNKKVVELSKNSTESVKPAAKVEDLNTTDTATTKATTADPVDPAPVNPNPEISPARDAAPVPFT